MNKLAAVVLSAALMAPFGGAWAQLGLLSGLAKAAAAEKAAAAAAKLALVEKGVVAERAAAGAGKLAAGAEAGTVATADAARGDGLAAKSLAAGERARGPDAHLAADAKRFGVDRAEDGRFVLAPGPGAARLVRSRVLTAVNETPRLVVARAHDGRFVPLTARGADAIRVAEASEALTDTIGTALYRAVEDLPAPGKDLRAAGARTRAPPETRAERLSKHVKSLIDSLQDPENLKTAKTLSVTRAAGVKGARLADVSEVVMLESKAQPPHLVLALEVTRQRPFEVLTRVNLDEVIKRIDKSGF